VGWLQENMQVRLGNFMTWNSEMQAKERDFIYSHGILDGR
jgi:hypothetical protein